MNNEKNRKRFMECLSDFMSDPENLTEEELLAELEEGGIDTGRLESRVVEIVRKGSAERRLAWLSKARERREEIEKILASSQITKGTQDLKKKIKEILKGSYGQAALSYAEAYFRKKESFSEKDLESLIEDLEHLNLLEGLSKKED
jgi:predicted transcriptional regulator